MAIIRAERVDDAYHVQRLHSAAFGDYGKEVNGLVEDLRPTIAEQGGFSAVAENDSGVVGHVMVTTSLLDSERRLAPAPVLGPLAVDPHHQGSGIGAGLMQWAIEAATEARSPFILLEGDPGYYSRFGFRPAGPLGFRKPSLRIPDAAFQILLLPDYEAWMTGTIVYAWPFWANDAVGLRS